MRVVIADDTMLTRQGIASVLADAGIEVVAAVGDPESLVREVAAHRPDAAVVDIRMPPTHTDEGIRGDRAAPGAPTRRCGCCCCRPTSSPSTPSGCWRTIPAGSATCSRTACSTACCWSTR